MKATLFKYWMNGKEEIDTFSDDDFDPADYEDSERFDFEMPNEDVEAQIKTHMSNRAMFKGAIADVDEETLFNIVFARVNGLNDFSDLEEVRQIVELNLREQVAEDFREQCKLEVKGSGLPEDGYCERQYCYDSKLILRNGVIVCPKCGAVYGEEAA